MNAAFGGVSAGGLGSPELDVTQSGGGPKAFVANQSVSAMLADCHVVEILVNRW